jgi:nicotinamidase-related amidase
MARTALIVVDMQNAFVKEGSLLVIPDEKGRSRRYGDSWIWRVSLA